MKTGKVKWYNDSKGFGFITPDEGGEDLFVHHSRISAPEPKALREGESVTFDVVTGGVKGPEAHNVKKANPW